MAYDKLRTVILYANATWYNVAVLMDIIKQLRSINFSIVEKRQQALETLNNMPTVSHPFAVDRRFPVDKLLICEMYGDWARKFQQLKSALSHKDRQAETSARLPSSESGRTQNNYDDKFLLLEKQSASDAQQAFWNATTDILDQLARMNGVFDRDTFEAWLDLTWA